VAFHSQLLVKGSDTDLPRRVTTRVRTFEQVYLDIAAITLGDQLPASKQTAFAVRTRQGRVPTDTLEQKALAFGPPSENRDSKSISFTCYYYTTHSIDLISLGLATSQCTILLALSQPPIVLVWEGAARTRSKPARSTWVTKPCSA
jgi:hypothetical protein